MGVISLLVIESIGPGSIWRGGPYPVLRTRANLEPLELLTSSPVEGQYIPLVPAQLGSHMQVLVLEFVVECAHTEVLQGWGLGRFSWGMWPWS